jgi:hypothetical protein
MISFPPHVTHVLQPIDVECVRKVQYWFLNTNLYKLKIQIKTPIDHLIKAKPSLFERVGQLFEQYIKKVVLNGYVKVGQRPKVKTKDSGRECLIFLR